MSYLLKFSFTAILFVVMIFAYSCSTENKPVYSITVDVTPNEAGSTTQKIIESKEGEIVEIEAAANEHWEFKKWTGDISETVNTNQTVFVRKDSDKLITAVFERKDYPLTVEVEGKGTVEEEIIQQKTTEYEYGTLVKLSALPETGWEFSHWTGASSSENEEIEVLIEGETDIKAVFKLKIFDLNIEIEGNGEVEESIVAAKTSEYTFGTMVELSAVPDRGWEFVRWEGITEGSDSAKVQILMDSDKEVKAVFQRSDFSLSLAVEGEGRVDQEIVQAAKTTSYTFETKVQLTAIPQTGWEFVEWRGDAEGTDQQIIITIDKDKNVEAVFKRQDFQLTIQINGQGTVNQEVTSQAKAKTYTYLTEVQLTATPADGWVFSSWSGDASGSQDVVIVSMDGDKEVHANFENITRHLSVQVNGQGSVNEQANQGGEGAYPFGTNVRLTAVPAKGWVFAGWSGAVTSKFNQVQVEMSQNKTVTVDFVPVPSKKRILPLGDSITNGAPNAYRYTLFNMLKGAGFDFQYVGSKRSNPAGYPGSWDTRHEGHIGASSKGINADLSNWLTLYTPDIALIHLGTNDVGYSIRIPGQFVMRISYMESIIEKLRADNPVVRIFIAKIIPAKTSMDSQYHERINTWNNWIQDLRNQKTTSISPIYIVDMNSNFGDSDLIDSIHPNETGAQKMAKRWYNSIIDNRF